MAQVLIPFATNVATGQLVAVDDVPSGKACQCICPGCKTPLIARHYLDGSRASNFAHSGRKDFQQTKAECHYSYLVSVRSMAKQILSSITARMTLPALSVIYPARTWMAFGETLFRPLRPYTAAQERPLLLDPATMQVEANFHGTVVDVLQQIPEQRPLVVYFTYDQRHAPRELLNSSIAVDVLQIDLRQIPVLLKATSAQSYVARLTQFLLTDIDSKSWIKHGGSTQLQEFRELIAREEMQMETEARYRAAERAQAQAALRKAQRQVGMHPKQDILQIPIYGESRFEHSPCDYRQRPARPAKHPPVTDPSGKVLAEQTAYRCRHCDAEYYQRNGETAVCPHCQRRNSIPIRYI